MIFEFHKNFKNIKRESSIEVSFLKKDIETGKNKLL